MASFYNRLFFWYNSSFLIKIFFWMIETLPKLFLLTRFNHLLIFLMTTSFKVFFFYWGGSSIWKMLNCRTFIWSWKIAAMKKHTSIVIGDSEKQKRTAELGLAVIRGAEIRSYGKLPSLKLTAKAPENRPSQKETIVFQPSIFRCYVSFQGVYDFYSIWFDKYVVLLLTSYLNPLFFLNKSPHFLNGQRVFLTQKMAINLNEVPAAQRGHVWGGFPFSITLICVSRSLFLPGKNSPGAFRGHSIGLWKKTPLWMYNIKPILFLDIYMRNDIIYRFLLYLIYIYTLHLIIIRYHPIIVHYTANFFDFHSV